MKNWVLLMVLLFVSSGLQAQSPGVFVFSGQNLQLTPGVSDASYGSETADMDGDGDLDLIFGGYCSVQNSVWINDGSGNFTTVLPFGTTSGGECEEEITVGDVNGDGFPDAVVSRSHRVYLNDGTGNLVFHMGLPTAGSRTGGTLGDLDGDGDLDLFLGSGTSGSLQVFKNDGAGNFTVYQTIGGYNQNNYVNLGDFDGDGDLDGIAPQRGGSGTPTRILFNDGTGNLFADAQNLGFNSYSKPAIGDFDGDGDLDIFMADNTPAASSIWLNDGAGIFSVGQTIAAGDRTLGSEAGDLDGDGSLDLFLANSAGPNTIWLNDGSGTFLNSGQSLGNCNSWNVALGDYNGDGFLDAGVGNPGGANKVWWNNIAPPSTPSLCPDPILANEAVAGDGGAIVYFSGNADPVICNPSLTYSQNPGTLFLLGETDVTVSDGSSSCVFRVTVLPFGVTSIPTMGQWGLIILGLVLLSIGAIALRSWQRKSFSMK